MNKSRKFLAKVRVSEPTKIKGEAYLKFFCSKTSVSISEWTSFFAQPKPRGRKTSCFPSMINMLKNISYYDFDYKNLDIDYVEFSYSIMAGVYMTLKDEKLPVKLKQISHFETGEIVGYGIDFGGAFWTPFGMDSAEALMIISGKENNLDYYNFKNIKLSKQEKERIGNNSFSSIFIHNKEIDLNELAFLSYNMKEENSFLKYSKSMIMEQPQHIFNQQKQFVENFKTQNPKEHLFYGKITEIPKLSLIDIDRSYAQSIEEITKQIQKYTNPIYNQFYKYLEQEYKFIKTQLPKMFVDNEYSQDIIRNLKNSKFVKISVQLNHEFEERCFLNLLSFEHMRHFTNFLLMERSSFKHVKGELFNMSYPMDMVPHFKKHPYYGIVEKNIKSKSFYHDHFFQGSHKNELDKVFLFEIEDKISLNLKSQKINTKAQKAPRF